MEHKENSERLYFMEPPSLKFAFGRNVRSISSHNDNNKDSNSIFAGFNHFETDIDAIFSDNPLNIAFDVTNINLSSSNETKIDCDITENAPIQITKRTRNKKKSNNNNNNNSKKNKYKKDDCLHAPNRGIAEPIPLIRMNHDSNGRLLQKQFESMNSNRSNSKKQKGDNNNDNNSKCKTMRTKTTLRVRHSPQLLPARSLTTHTNSNNNSNNTRSLGASELKTLDAMEVKEKERNLNELNNLSLKQLRRNSVRLERHRSDKLGGNEKKEFSKSLNNIGRSDSYCTYGSNSSNISLLSCSNNNYTFNNQSSFDSTRISVLNRNNSGNICSNLCDNDSESSDSSSDEPILKGKRKIDINRVQVSSCLKVKYIFAFFFVLV